MVEWFEDKIYIKMCMKSTELQRDWKLHDGDFLYDIRISKTIIYLEELNEEYIEDFGQRYDFEFCDVIFRQDQLQPLVYRQNVSIPELGCTAKYQNNHQLIKSFLDFLFFEPVNTDMEKLWLAFVMKELYHKIWNGEDWILE